MFSLLILVALVTQCRGVRGDGSPTLIVTPSEITLGLTKSVSIECSSRNGPISPIVNLMSIGITYTKEDEAGTIELVAVTAFEGLTIHKDIEQEVIATGQINNTGVSLVTITLTNPQQDNAGVYTCELIGFNRKGKLATVNVSEEVLANSPTIDLAMKEIESMRKESEEMAQTIDTLNAKYNNIVSDNSKMTTGLNQLQTEVQLIQNKSQLDWNIIQYLQEKFEQLEQHEKEINIAVKTQETRINASIHEYLFASDNFNGRRYWLTKEATFFSVAFAQAVCVFFGGYLAEIDTHEEFNFVRNYLMQRVAPFENIVVGGTDEGHEGLWVNRHGKTAVASFWAPGQPSDRKGEQNCQSFYKQSNWYLDDFQCVWMSTNTTGFLCEIPE